MRGSLPFHAELDYSVQRGAFLGGHSLGDQTADLCAQGAHLTPVEDGVSKGIYPGQ